MHQNLCWDSIITTQLLTKRFMGWFIALETLRHRSRIHLFIFISTQYNRCRKFCMITSGFSLYNLDAHMQSTHAQCKCQPAPSWGINKFTKYSTRGLFSTHFFTLFVSSLIHSIYLFVCLFIGSFDSFLSKEEKALWLKCSSKFHSY